jgi:hypothetical protein
MDTPKTLSCSVWTQDSKLVLTAKLRWFWGQICAPGDGQTFLSKCPGGFSPPFRVAKERRQTLPKEFLIACLAFPDNKTLPSTYFERFNIPSIPRLVPFKLRHPIFPIRFRNMRGLAIVGMPKAPVNENRLPPRSKNQIRFSREIFSMQPEPVPQGMHETPHL